MCWPGVRRPCELVVPCLFSEGCRPQMFSSRWELWIKSKMASSPNSKVTWSEEATVEALTELYSEESIQLSLEASRKRPQETSKIYKIFLVSSCTQGEIRRLRFRLHNGECIQRKHQSRSQSPRPPRPTWNSGSSSQSFAFPNRWSRGTRALGTRMRKHEYPRKHASTLRFRKCGSAETHSLTYISATFTQSRKLW